MYNFGTTCDSDPYCDLIPFILLNRYDYNTAAFLLVLFHDFLDHLDGIVAKVQKVVYGQIDDPILGGFMDAFCDKVVIMKYLILDVDEPIDPGAPCRGFL